jgi:hypothetical protein
MYVSIKAVLLIILIVSGSFAFGQNAEQILKERGEVYFSFNIEKGESYREDLATISRIISIDNVNDREVFAYANAKGFKQFKQLGYQIQVLTPPSMLLNQEILDMNNKSSDWDFYPTYQQYLGIMAQFAEDYPDICEVVNIGESVYGRDILVLHISDSLEIEQDEPEVFYTSSIHGDEITGYVLMLQLSEYLLENYGTDDRITNMVNEIDIWINPSANPDGTYAGGDFTVFGATRGNANSVDLNRNYPDPQWGEHPDGNSHQPETQVFMAFAEAHHFAMSVNIHGGIEVANYPWDTWSWLCADTDWWEHICRQYADTAHVNSPNGYFTALDNGVTNGYAWYEVAGGRQDYMNYNLQCREFTLEISYTKLPPPDQLSDFWDYNYRSFLNYLEQSLYGLRGLVSDANTGEALHAEIYIAGHDEDSSQVYSYPPVGDYHRYLSTGTYAVTFQANGYTPQVIDEIEITNDNTTFLNVQLVPIVDGLNEEAQLAAQILVYPNPAIGNVTVLLPENADEITLTTITGQKVLRMVPHSKKTELTFDNLPKGVYLLNIRFDQTVINKKLLID